MLIKAQCGFRFSNTVYLPVDVKKRTMIEKMEKIRNRTSGEGVWEIV